MASARRERQLGLITPQMQRYEAPAVEGIRDALNQQVCPFCGAGPFTVVATHVALMHHIDRLTLRQMAGLDRLQSICDPTHSASRSALSKIVNKATVDVRRDALANTWHAKNDARDERIIALSREGKSFVDIGELLDVSVPTVRTVAKRYGLRRIWGIGTDRVCEECGRQFKVAKPSVKTRFCSASCSSRATTSRLGSPAHRGFVRKAAPRESRICLGCGSTFVVKGWQGLPNRYCSNRCANATRQRSSDGQFL